MSHETSVHVGHSHQWWHVLVLGALYYWHNSGMLYVHELKSDDTILEMSHETSVHVGHSHQWWHVLVLGALYYWHNSGMLYVQYRMNHGCANNMRIF
ncbi:unnamed protein product [Plutella xylostella]|uniref:(diamondback moth) hypothetical protein n=1 Tax=Plutella xylostella TaxID=51655 RepID=A0A8S4EV23_PLUXY|nr:unnamed protein product [Plutella xylostella]CAG9119476.1 unnamed protein product [Plutella xylostella]